MRRRPEPKPMTTDISEHAPDASPGAPSASSPSKASTGQGRALSSACRPTALRQRGIRVVSSREPGGSPFAEKLRTLILEQRLLVGSAESHPSVPSSWPDPTTLRPASDRQTKRSPQSRGRSWPAHRAVHPLPGTSRRDGWTGIDRSWHKRRKSRAVRTPSSGCDPSRSPVCTAS